MTLVSLDSYLPYPAITMSNINYQYAGNGLTSANHKVAFIFRMPKSGSVDGIWLRTATFSGTQTVTIRIETLDSSGIPSGMLYHPNATSSFSSVTNTSYDVPLAGLVPVTTGDVIAIVFSAPTYVSGNWAIVGLQYPTNNYNFPYVANYNGTSWSKATSHLPSLGLKYSDGTYPYIFRHTAVDTGMGNYTINATSGTLSGQGMRFQLPITARVAGFWMSYITTGGYIASLTTDSNVTLTSATMPEGANTQSSFGHSAVTFDQPVVLDADTNYRLMIDATGTANTTIGRWRPNSIRPSLVEGGASRFGLLERNRTSGVITVDMTWRPSMGLLIDAFHKSDVSGRYKAKIDGAIVDIL